jgi:hypothetical protein
MSFRERTTVFKEKARRVWWNFKRDFYQGAPEFYMKRHRKTADPNLGKALEWAEYKNPPEDYCLDATRPAVIAASIYVGVFHLIDPEEVHNYVERYQAISKIPDGKAGTTYSPDGWRLFQSFAYMYAVTGELKGITERTREALGKDTLARKVIIVNDDDFEPIKPVRPARKRSSPKPTPRVSASTPKQIEPKIEMVKSETQRTTEPVVEKIKVERVSIRAERHIAPIVSADDVLKGWDKQTVEDLLKIVPTNDETISYQKIPAQIERLLKGILTVTSRNPNFALREDDELNNRHAIRGLQTALQILDSRPDINNLSQIQALIEKARIIRDKKRKPN